MRTTVPILAAALALPGCAQESRGVSVTNAVITLPAVPGRPGAAYFTLHSDRPTRLTAIAIPNVERIELHEYLSNGAISEMRPLGEVAVAPVAPLLFEPGGRHAMLFGIAPSLREGQRVTMTFSLAGLPPLRTEAEVRGPGQAHSSH
jgi:copper(I)-binding protein